MVASVGLLGLMGFYCSVFRDPVFRNFSAILLEGSLQSCDKLSVNPSICLDPFAFRLVASSWILAMLRTQRLQHPLIKEYTLRVILGTLVRFKVYSLIEGFWCLWGGRGGRLEQLLVMI